MRPNIFDIATSELSQDAFLCWFLICADVSHKDNCPELHALGQALLSEIFFRANDRTPPAAITSVKPRRQLNDIDILCTMNGNIAIAIEDKTGTVESPHQLEKYRRHLLEKLGYLGPFMRAVFVYIHTGNQGDYDGVRKAGYSFWNAPTCSSF